MPERLLSKIDTDRILGDARNLYSHLLGGGFADLSRTPSVVIYDEPQCAVHRYNPVGDLEPDALPVLMVPPLSAPATAFDLRQGCSVVQFFVEQNRPTYLVDYGDLSTQKDSDLGLDHWMDTILPTAIKTVSADAGDRPVHLLGWSLGGIMALFTHAAHPDLPIASVGAVGSPFDFDHIAVFEPLRLLSDSPGSKLPAEIIRRTGGVPGKLATLGFRFADPVRLVQKPKFLVQVASNPDVLAQIQAVDALMDTMEAYPGRTVQQLYADFITQNHLAGGKLEVGDRTVELTAVTAPVMNIAGDADQIFGPVEAVHHLAKLVPNAAEARMEMAHGGHMGVLTGGGARTGTWAYLDDFFRSCDERT